MDVGVAGDADVGVPQVVGHDLQGDPGRECERRKRVSEIVEPDPGQAGRLVIPAFCKLEGTGQRRMPLMDECL